MEGMRQTVYQLSYVGQWWIKFALRLFVNWGLVCGCFALFCELRRCLLRFNSSINNRQSQIPTCRAPLPTSFLHHMLSFLCLDFCFVVLIKSLSIFLFHYISKFHPSNSGSIPINTNHCRATIMDTSIHGVMENV